MSPIRSAVIAAMGVSLTASFVVVGGPAVADTNGCATRAEFGHVSNGMNIDRVRNILDTGGTKAGRGEDPSTGVQWQERWYTKCSSDIFSGLKYSRVKYEKRSGTWRVVRKDW